MAYNDGRERSAGIGKESVYGTDVAATRWYPHQEFSVSDQKVTITDNSGIGVRDSNLGIETDHVLAQGNFNGLIYSNQGEILLAAAGTIASENHSSATGVKVHTITPGGTLGSWTISAKDKNDDVRFAGAYCDSLSIVQQVGAFASFSSSWIGRKSASDSNSPSYSGPLVRFLPKDTTIKYASTVDGLAGASESAYFQGFNFTLNNNIQTIAQLGTEDPDFYPGSFTASLTLDRTYFDTTFKSLVFADTPQAVQITLRRPDVVIGTHETPENNTIPSIALIFEPGYFSEWQQQGGNDDVMTEQIGFQPVRSFSTSKAMSIVVTDTVSSY